LHFCHALLGVAEREIRSDDKAMHCRGAPDSYVTVIKYSKNASTLSWKIIIMSDCFPPYPFEALFWICRVRMSHVHSGMWRGADRPTAREGKVYEDLTIKPHHVPGGAMSVKIMSSLARESMPRKDVEADVTRMVAHLDPIVHVAKHRQIGSVCTKVPVDAPLSLAESTSQRREMESHTRKERSCILRSKNTALHGAFGKVVYTSGSRKRDPVIAKWHRIVLGCQTGQQAMLIV